MFYKFLKRFLSYTLKNTKKHKRRKQNGKPDRKRSKLQTERGNSFYGYYVFNILWHLVFNMVSYGLKVKRGDCYER